MNRQRVYSLLLVMVLIAGTFVALGFGGRDNTVSAASPNDGAAVFVKNGPVSVTGKLTQNKVLTGRDGRVGLSLTLTAEKIFSPETGGARYVDMVVVLDRSGSMEGQKIMDAKDAVLKLLDNLSDLDRFGLVSYSNGVTRHTGLTYVTAKNRQWLKNAVHGVYAGGGTNLGAGLKEGVDMIASAEPAGNIQKVLLVSDGRANQGVTHPKALGELASRAPERSISVSAVGVGLDFNEQIMTTIADRGAGRYYFMENPNAFARIFDQEFRSARIAAANGLEIIVPIQDGAALIDAAGYPVQVKNGKGFFRPGDLLSGQTRKLFLTFQVPTNKAAEFEIKGLQVRYRHQDEMYTVDLNRPFHVAVVADEKAVYASVDKDEWEKKVVQEDYNRLREEVAVDIRDGNKESALKKIKNYRKTQESFNDVIGSAEVTLNLKKDVGDLRQTVMDSFAPSAGEYERKMNSKAVQHEGYKGRRAY